MTRTVSKINAVKVSTDKPSDKPLLGDISFGIDPAIRFYGLEDGDKTEEVEDVEILIIQYKILAATKQNIFKRNLPYINMFGHQGPEVVHVMCNLPRYSNTPLVRLHITCTTSGP